MKLLNLMTATALATTISFSAMAETEHHPEEAAESASAKMPMGGGQMPMMGAQQGGMMNPQMMQNMMAMRQKHMQTMETRLANIEALLRQLVELQKQK